MKEVQYYKENDFNYKSFDLTEKEIKAVSEYYEHDFKKGETFLNCMYDLKGNLMAAQVNEDSTWDLSPEEVNELFFDEQSKESFKRALEEFYTIDWSETDGKDVKKILKDAFLPFLNHKPEIIEMFNTSKSLNGFQKMMITEMFLEL